jgi:hypothetical protein
MLIALSIIITFLIAAIIGVIAYIIMGTWVAFLIAFLGSIIAVCVTVGIVKIVKIIKGGEKLQTKKFGNQYQNTKNFMK